MPKSKIILDKIAMIGSYSPRRCGIATFTYDLVSALKNNIQKTKIDVLAMNDSPGGYLYSEDVQLEILDSQNKDYLKAADFLNTNMVDVVNIQHEFGIFGGHAGKKILHLINNVRMPVIVTLHTVLQAPEEEYSRVFLEIAERADRLIVMTNKAKQILQTTYSIPDNKIAVIPHGIPDVSFIDSAFYKDKFELIGKKVLLTFGLLSPNKGLEVMIRAMPKILEKHPEAVYIILGSLHPNERREHGTSYLNKLQLEVINLGLEKSVFFIDGFFSLEELCEYIGAADIYAIPYLNKEQITSGTLAYAMGAGKPIVSTPFWHAEEYLAEGRGVLAEFNNPQSFSDNIIDLLDNEAKRSAIRKKAYEFTRPMIWNEVAKQYYSIYQDLIYERIIKPKKTVPVLESRYENIQIPDINLSHFKALTDCTGILEHAKFSIPDRSHGYCLDDNARALIVSILYYQLTRDESISEFLNRYLGFVLHAFDVNIKRFRNRLTYERVWDYKDISDAAHGRAIWALGQCCANGPEHVKKIALKLFRDSTPVIQCTTHPMAMAFSIIGIHKYLYCFEGDSFYKGLLKKLANNLMTIFENKDDPDWPWFEDEVAWGSATIARGLIVAGKRLSDKSMIEKGLGLLEWLISLQLKDSECFSFIGNNGWYKRGGSKALFDQQPIEAQSMVGACIAAYKVTGKKVWLEKVRLAINWFLGLNVLNIPIYDYSTGGCRDGLQSNWVNENEGAESTIAWLISLLEYKILQNEDDLQNNLTLF
jgi:glycosyltransferase involved in cell wall biosynthesis